MSRRLDLLLGSAAGWFRSSKVGTENTPDPEGCSDGHVTRVPEAETRAGEIQSLLQLSYPAIHWSVVLELQRRALGEGPLEQYVVVKGLRRDGTSMPPIRIFWRDAATTQAPRLVRQIVKGLRLDA